MKLLALRRLIRIQQVVVRYQLDDLLLDLPLPWWLHALLRAAPWHWLPRAPLAMSRGERLRRSLEDLGPVFIKFGQLLSTRRDLLPPDIADELARLQDQVPPFPPEQAVALIEQQLGARIDQVFSRFEHQPLASASVAQVHAAQLRSGEDVVVKVVRPGLEPVIRQDMAWLFALARVMERASADARRLRPVEVVGDYEKTIFDELDLLREAANGTQLRRNFDGSPLLYVPQVYWDWCRPKVLVMERIYGIPVTDLAALHDQHTDMKKLAERGVEIFFTQVFRDSFFHADMHPGNIFVSTRTPHDPQYIAIDCGIIGSLTAEDQDYLARNLLAFFKRDYRKVAQLHIDSGWVPAETRLNDFEAAIRTVCEPVFEKPLKDISFGQVLLRLFQTARRFNMEVQPQLVLLQKTLLNIEGLGRQLYPELDLWSTAKPYLERWMRQRMSPLRLLHNLQSQAEQMPVLAKKTRAALDRLGQGCAPATPPRSSGVERLLGAVLLLGAASQGLAPAVDTWPAWVMLAGGLYLVLRR
ncbi:ubiquinone biosynthesis regulatory protein kinase UbiB [Pseudomonas sp. GCM10022188]|uniref:ubiquinone biosynthesis regulatory protein kinase UbiB n=1 Tax=Pseudomonas TaxID=286 RepID=UPI001E62CF33|nr:ubiquinone biosynthesis regulatory protein kinase UbiB [Pseudomonas oryzagri]MCC6076346.1 ubiquinone biosynthesis regulatory protein kinase UbiB [Pseudomonas oryzagri]